MTIEIIGVHVSRRDDLPAVDLSDQIVGGLSRPVGEKQLPTMLLYDERGLQLYDIITTSAPEYYPFAAEEEILKENFDEIVRCMHSCETRNDNAVVLELGAGSLRKTPHLLRGLARYARSSELSSPIAYYALDLEKRELERTLGEIGASDIGRELVGKVTTKGICGTYDDGIKFIEEGGLAKLSAVQSLPAAPAAQEAGNSTSSVEALQPQLHIVFLGSSLGNFPRNDATAFLRSLPLQPGRGDTLLLGLDHDNGKEKIEIAYNDPQGHTKRFKMNALRNAGRTLGDEHLFDESKWEYVNRYDSASRCHESFFQSKCAQTLHAPLPDRKFQFSENELIKIEESVKYSEADADKLFSDAGLRPVRRWMDTKEQYSLWLLERQPIS